MKIGNEYISLEITCKRSTNFDPISQDTVEKCIKIAMEACVGFLHDVVEDTDWTFDDLRNEGVPEEVIEALQLCTHNESKDYYEYVQQIIDSGNLTAIHVKLNDLRHNIARGKAFGYADLVAKHEKALQMIEDFLQKNKRS